MGSYRLRLHVIAAVFVAVLGLLIAGQRLLRATAVDRPLVFKLQALSGVAGADLRRDGSRATVVIRLEGNGDLASVYAQAYSVCRAELGSRMQGLLIEDTRTPELEGALRKASLEIWEAVRSGRFSDAGAALAAEARRIGARCLVTMDERFVYIDMAKGQARLCQVVDWRDAGPSGQAMTQTIGEKGGAG